MKEDSPFVPAITIKERVPNISNRQDALYAYARAKLWGKLSGQHWHDCHYKSELMKAIIRQWHAQAVLMHLNRGCEGTSLGQLENRLALTEAGIPVLDYEGNMGDPKEFDLPRTISKLDNFFETLGIKKLSEAG